MTGHDTATAVVLPSTLEGMHLSVKQDSNGKTTESNRKELISSVDETGIGKGLVISKPEEIIPSLSVISIDSETGEVILANRPSLSLELFGAEAAFDSDDRIRILNTKSWPWSVHGALLSAFPNGTSVLGSGTVVNKHHVLTAGHNVYQPNRGGWAVGCKFIPGWNVSPGVTVENQTPFGEANGSRFISVKGWTENLKREYDYAMIILDRDIGESTGWFAISYLTKNILLQHRINISGYPANKGGDSLYTHHEKINSISDQQIGYRADTSPGQSGAAVWIYQSDFIKQPTIVAVHNYGYTGGPVEENISTRINEPIFDTLIQWMKRW